MLQELFCVNMSNDSYLRALLAEWRELFKQSANQTVLVGVSLCCSLWHAHRKLTISNHQAPSIKSVVKNPTVLLPPEPFIHYVMMTWQQGFIPERQRMVRKESKKMSQIKNHCVSVRVSGSVNLKF